MTPWRGRYIVMFIFALLSTGAGLVIPLVTRAVIDGPIANSDHRGLIALGLFALTLGVVEAVLMFARRWTVSKATLGTETGIRLDLYGALQRLPMKFHGQWQSGQLLSRIMNDLSTVRRFLGFGVLFMITNFLQITTVTVLLLNMYWPLGLIVLATSVPVTWLCLVNSRKFTRLSRQIQDQTGDVASSVEEGAHGLRVIKAFGRARFVYEKFNQRSETLYHTWMARIRLSSYFWTFLEVIPGLSLIVVLGVGAAAAGTGKISLGTLVAFVTMMLSLVGPMASLGFLLAQAQEAMTAGDRVCDVLDAENEITDGHVDLDTVEGALSFENVGFRFHDGDSDVLHDLNLDLAPGETVALVGGTGSGKTVFTSLVPRLDDVTAGRITIDCVDIRDLRLARLRTIVATAFEDPTLFSMSARENLTLGALDATEADIAEAIDVAQAHFVYDLPWGLDTRIGEQGMSLSGGQRQRLALARAVLVKPRILVLDDTLSALDIHTEELVEAALKRVLVGVTGIVVAHRASTVMLADRVAMLKGGTITHVGTHSELLATVPAYRDLLAGDFDSEQEMAEIDEVPPTNTDGAHSSGGDDDTQDVDSELEAASR
ncbi:MAG: ABC transporter ATP-binding protein [Propionibacteriaceae bacterium]